MIYGMYVSAAGAMANSYRQDVVANNLANVDTVSFKRDLALMRGRRTEAAASGTSCFSNRLLEGIGGGGAALPTYTDFSPAALEITGKDFDLALDGKGFFQVLKGTQLQFTRDGRFALNDEDRLVTLTEHLPVLDESGNPIVINRALDFNVNQAGMINQAGQAVARLGIVDFDDTATLRKQGDNLYVNEGGGVPRPVAAVVLQKALEGSGVNPVRELTEMIKIQRLLETNLNMLQIQDQTLGLAVNRLARIS